MPQLITTDVDAAVRALRDGHLVAMPTETVYGLAGRADSPNAVARIYQAKGRPATHPVIVHLADPAELSHWARTTPEWLAELTQRHWPGPLTVIVTRADHVGDDLTGGQDTVGLRVPGHPVAHDLLQRFGGAVAAPSANRFGHVSPTTAQHVLDELGQHLDPAVDVILDGGQCPVGLESTIVDATGRQPRLVRPGRISAAMIEEATGLPLLPPTTQVRAPGQLDAHYAPRAAVVVSTPDDLDAVTHALLSAAADRPVGVIGLDAVVRHLDSRVRRLVDCRTDTELAHDLYDALRTADDLGMATVLAVLPPPTGDGVAIRDRMTKAAGGRADEPR